MQLPIKRLHPESKLPTFAHAADAGMDLFSVEDVSIPVGSLVKIPTGISVNIPHGYVALVWDKSGIAVGRKLKTFGGVIDAGYTGEWFVNLMNFGTDTQEFKKGDKIAQVLIQKVEHPEIIEVDELEESDRGEGGFGSTGVN